MVWGAKTRKSLESISGEKQNVSFHSSSLTIQARLSFDYNLRTVGSEKLLVRHIERLD
jgi:hypothetical protein